MIRFIGWSNGWCFAVWRVREKFHWSFSPFVLVVPAFFLKAHFGQYDSCPYAFRTHRFSIAGWHFPIQPNATLWRLLGSCRNLQTGCRLCFSPITTFLSSSCSIAWNWLGSWLTFCYWDYWRSQRNYSFHYHRDCCLLSCFSCLLGWNPQLTWLWPIYRNISTADTR